MIHNYHLYFFFFNDTATTEIYTLSLHDALPILRSTRRAYLIGVAVGQTNIYFFDADGHQIAGFDVAVTRDLNGVRAMLQKMLPHADVRVDGVGDGVMLSGSVGSTAESQQAYDVAARLVGDGQKVVNNITIRS